MSRTNSDVRSDFRGDVIYNVWRQGGDVDAIDLERVDRLHEEEGWDSERVSEYELQRQAVKP